MLLSDADILLSVQATLKLTTALPSYWTQVVADTHAYAWSLVQRRLLARGYTLAQIDAWDDAAIFERRQATYEALVLGGGLSDANPRWVEKLNVADEQKGELSTVVLYSGGSVVTPQGATGQCSSGGFDTSGDVFQWPEDCDPRAGEPTRW